MGYDMGEIRIPLRLDNHGGDQQRLDRQEAENLAKEIRALIKRIPAYERIAILGVEGGR